MADVERTHCSKCGVKLEYSDRRDAYFCPICDEWKEPNCGNPNCEFCAGRPEKPSQDTPIVTSGMNDIFPCCGNCVYPDGGTCWYAGEVTSDHVCAHWKLKTE